MTAERKEIGSEYTADMTPEQAVELQEKTGSMTEEELAGFRNGMDPDSMGFCKEEGTEDE